MFIYVAETEKGKNKKANDDRIFVDNTIISKGEFEGKRKDSVLAVMCDGVGGERGGDFAAQTVVNSFKNWNTNNLSIDKLSEHLIGVNKDLCMLQKMIPKNKEMATTIAGVFLCGNKYIAFNLGDTRIYKNNNEMELLSKDHTVAQERILKKEISFIQEASVAERSTITKYIGGYGKTSHPYFKIGTIKENDRYFLICTDGIYKSVPKKQIELIMKDDLTICEKKRAILSLAKQYSSDDMSLILIDVSKVLV